MQCIAGSRPASITGAPQSLTSIYERGKKNFYSFLLFLDIQIFHRSQAGILKVGYAWARKLGGHNIDLTPVPYSLGIKINRDRDSLPLRPIQVPTYIEFEIEILHCFFSLKNILSFIDFFHSYKYSDIRICESHTCMTTRVQSLHPHFCQNFKQRENY